MEKQKSNLLIKPFLEREGTLFDVRSPSEFLRGHIPGAVNLPLFTDEERAIVGTAYKQKSQAVAIQLGLQFVTPKIESLIAAVGDIPQAKLYCWRGGLRSQSMAQLLRSVNIPAVTLEGGYKSFRHWIEQLFSTPRKLTLLGGLTGCGKTEKLQDLHRAGEQVIDLEALANHKGSCFGHIGMQSQPSTEHFQNLIGMQLSKMDPEKNLWMEDESRALGPCHLPESLYKLMCAAPLQLIECSMGERLQRLNRDYGFADPQDLIEAIQKLRNKLGGKRAQEAIQEIEEGNLKEAATIVLEYYDKTYTHGLYQKKLKNQFLAQPIST